ncbi:MAG: hypothetical protein VXY77_03060 [Pseudomonadota bacterium]|nr:hypothetical protein [Pseudomonadota bacterium]
MQKTSRIAQIGNLTKKYKDYSECWLGRRWFLEGFAQHSRRRRQYQKPPDRSV